MHAGVCVCMCSVYYVCVGMYIYVCMCVFACALCVRVLLCACARVYNEHGYDILNSFINNPFSFCSITNVVISGVLTNLCCETTARSAFVKDFNVFFLSDGNATASEEMHKATLLNLVIKLTLELIYIYS